MRSIGAGLRRGDPRPTWWVAFAVLWLVLAVWALSVPRFGGPDEQVHVVKAVGVARGDLSTETDRRPSGFGMQVPWTKVRGANGYRKLFDQVRCWSGKQYVPTSCAPAMAAEAGREVGLQTYVGTYQPGYYAAVGWPTRLLSPHRAVLLARLISAGMVAALLASAWVSAGALGGSLVRAATVALVTPTMAFLGGVVNPSGVEVAAAISLWVTALLLWERPRSDRRTVLRALVAACVLGGVRPSGPLLLVGVLVITAMAAGTTPAWHVLRARRSVRWSLAVGAAVVLASAVHVIDTDALGSVITVDSGYSHADGARLAWEKLGTYLDEQLGLISWVGSNQLEAPGPYVDVWVAAVAALSVWALVVGDARRRLVLVAMVLASVVLLPVAAQTASPDVIWQGRYSLPVLVGVPLLAAWTIARSRRAPAALADGLLIVTAIASAANLLLAQQLLMSRNLYGAPSAIFTKPVDFLWDGPASPHLLGLLAAGASIGVVALAALAVTASDRSAAVPGEPPSPPSDPAALATPN